jgi:hypothetical protein
MNALGGTVAYMVTFVPRASDAVSRLRIVVGSQVVGAVILVVISCRHPNERPAEMHKAT